MDDIHSQYVAVHTKQRLSSTILPRRLPPQPVLQPLGLELLTSWIKYVSPTSEIQTTEAEQLHRLKENLIQGETYSNSYQFC